MVSAQPELTTYLKLAILVTLPFHFHYLTPVTCDLLLYDVILWICHYAMNMPAESLIKSIREIVVAVTVTVTQMQYQRVISS